MEPKKPPKFVWYDALKNEVEKSQAQKLYSIKMTLKPSEIMTFVGGLHDIQADMIESVVKAKEAQGFPEATELLKHIMERK
jgi:hypothetical protein